MPNSGPLKSPGRIVLWCPHIHWYIAASVASKALGQMGSSKYQWMKQLITANMGSVYVYCDTQYSSLTHYCEDPLSKVDSREQKKELVVREAQLWSELNSLPLSKEHFLSEPSQIESGDIVFTFSLSFLTTAPSALPSSSDLVKVFSRTDIFKVAHLSHYIFFLATLSQNIRDLKIDMLCYESDISKTDFVKRYAGVISEVTVIPFAVQNRFQNLVPSAEREPRCLMSGGISSFKLTPATKEFYFQFSTNTFCPLRTLIAENSEILSPYIESVTGEYEAQMKEARAKRSLDLHGYTELLNLPASSISEQSKDTTYYSQDIVGLYNKYLFSYVSEEVSYSPALGFFESMACGAVPIGIESFIYEDVGLEKYKHYLPFDGTLGGLVQTINIVRQRPEEVAHIPVENKALIESKFTESAVAKLFITALEEKYLRWNSKKAQAVASPFYLV